MQFSNTQKSLLHLLSDGEFHSGTHLAEQLALSRSAIWKHINALEAYGLEISAVTGKGYRLNRQLELLDKEKIYALIPQAIAAHIKSFELHDQIDSTNSYLSALAHKEPDSSAIICLAEQQVAGRGRRGRTWVSPFGSNIYLSILWRFEQGPASLSGLSLAIGVAVINALKVFHIKNVGLKWPNDIYWQQKKLGGILVEVSGESDGPCSAVIGLGLNLYLAEQDATGIEQDWVDLQQILNASGQQQAQPSRNQLVAALIEQLLQVTRHYSSQPFAYYRDRWREYDCMQGQAISLFVGKMQVEGTVQGIDDEGLLLLKTEDGRVQRFASGEVSFRKQ
ncbi:MAG: bifunctional biotin--[acetyl-CoA-carboxylase] ligase/biotin operon repressor BirA [Methyloprofundus sp.]|nr:bifunctional biotin--[acetyl-CoA-carboxylase] ligase/biotin operon repressor BirA [Methyloprofundus sp.]